MSEHTPSDIVDTLQGLANVTDWHGYTVWSSIAAEAADELVALRSALLDLYDALDECVIDSPSQRVYVALDNARSVLAAGSGVPQPEPAVCAECRGFKSAYPHLNPYAPCPACGGSGVPQQEAE